MNIAIVTINQENAAIASWLALKKQQFLPILSPHIS